MSTLPLLPPPPPRFPQTFTDQDDDKLQPQLNGYARVEGKEGGVGIEWKKVKTDGEEHVQRLEDKLKELSKRQGAESPARPPSLAEPDLAQLNDHEGDTRFHFEETEPTTDEAEGEAAGHEEEGRALLSIAEDEGEHRDHDMSMSTNGGLEDEEEDNEADLSGNDDEPRSRSRHPFQGLTAAQRISFSNSVRISGGIHTSHRPHRHRPAIETYPRRSPSAERTNPMSREGRPEATPSPLLVASVTSSSANTPSRATSPAGRGSQHSSFNLLAPKPRRLSASSHVSSNFAYPYAYSASPGSQVPSRGSSPCSSIYAPLQPPSKHTPNPLFVRPSQRLQRNRSSSGLSFQEYLRDGYDAFGGSDDDSDAISPKSPGYRELVEQQRRKRAKWEERRKRRVDEHKRKRIKDQAGGEEDETETGGFWESLKKILAMGHTGGAGRAGGSFGSPTVFRHSSRLPSNANYGSTSNSTPPPLPPQPPPRPRGILTSSRSIEDIHPPPPRPRTRSARSQSQSQSHPPPKTELDARFGSAPFRYFTIAFLLFKIHQLVAAVKEFFSTASKGMAKQKERERLLRQRQGGYEAV